MTLVWAMLLGLAHPSTAFQPTEAALLKSDDVALMRVVAATQVKSDRALTQVERVSIVDGEPPAQATVEQAGPHLHRFEAGTLVIMPLLRDGARWRYQSAARRGMRVEARTQRQAVAFARRWRRRAPRGPEQSVEAWINLLNHPAAVARSIGHEALVQHADRLRATLSDAQLDRLMVPLTMAGIPEHDHLARVRMVGLLGEGGAARRLAAVFDQLATDRVRRMAVGVMSRFPHADAKAVMRRCAISAAGSLKMRCDRVMQRLEGPAP